MARSRFRLRDLAIVMGLMLMLLSACNLTSTQDEINTTTVPTNTSQAFVTSTNVAQIPTSAQVTALPQPTGIFPTSILPPTRQFVTNTPSLIALQIFSPVPGNVVAGNVQIVGSAIHPSFLQYQLEFGPDPNPGNLWFPIGSARLLQVQNNLLGIWSTSGTIPDGVYQIRLRAYLRDGNILQTVVNAITVRNSSPTPVPSVTPVTPRPVAGFTSDVSSGFSPLVVRFTDQSTGVINSYDWNFGDGSRNSNRNPRHTFRNPGVYDVRLTVVGPGGQSNFSRRIVVQGSNPPVANFTLTPSSGQPTLRVQFTDTSSGDINGYLWNFGDGITTTERNPLHDFTTVGEYNVILEVRGRDGSSSRVTKRVSVVNPQVQKPVANFTPKSLSGDAALNVEFRSTSTGEIDTYLWDFGNGDSSTDANPIYQYTEPGIYTVKLTVSNEGGPSEATGTITVNRAPEAPIADFTAAPTSGNATLRVQFTDNSSGTIVQREWNFGDGNSSSEVSPRHDFTDPGTYKVRLTLLGEGGTSDFHEVDISVTEPLAPPSADFISDPTEGSAPLEVEFTNQSSGDNITSRWDFGDGQSSDSQDAVIDHTYQVNGIFTVTLTVSGPGGPNSVATETITVTNALLASFTALPATNPPGLGVQFTDTSTGNPTSWQWNFGDTETSAEQNPIHTYGAAGTYNVQLTVSNGQSSQTSQQPVTVNEPPTPPTAAFEVVATDGLQVTFADRSTSNVNSWQWDFGDNSGVIDIQKDPVYVYSAPGTYTVTLTVANEAGPAQASQEIVVAEAVQPPVTSFTFTVNGQSVTFSDTSTGSPTAWQWDFGDNQTRNEQSPVHEYAAPGTYTVNLTTSNEGGSTQASQQVVIQPPAQPPVADFTFATDGFNVTFTDQSGPSGSITSWAWDFGDGAGFSGDQEPTYVYGSPNTYTVTLTVANAEGLTGQIQKEVEIAPQAEMPTANFTYTAEGTVVTFTDTSTGAPTSWQWQFGDPNGTTSVDQSPVFDYVTPGTYPVTLTVTNAAGSSTSQQDVVMELVDVTPEESILDTTNILPDMGAIADDLRPVYQNGGKRADVFVVVGGREASQDTFLRPFGDGEYTLRNDGENVRSIIEWYSASDLNSFAQVGSAIIPDISAADLANNANPASNPSCEGGETQLACEVRLTQAAVVVIGIGYRDARGGTDPEQFRGSLQTLVNTALDNGAIPVLMTPYPFAGEEDLMRPIAEIIIEVANDNNIPVLNVWRLMNETTDGGVSGNAPTVSPEGADVLANALIRDFGENARTYYLLRLLSDLRDNVLN